MYFKNCITGCCKFIFTCNIDHCEAILCNEKCKAWEECKPCVYCCGNNCNECTNCDLNCDISC